MKVRPGSLLLIVVAALAALWSSVEIAAGDGTIGQAQYLPISAKVEIGGETILLEVARSLPQRALGLMFRPPLPDDHGMLFPWNPPQPVRMWMMNVPVPLDMLFIHDGRVIGVAEQVPPCTRKPCPTYGPFRQVVDHVLELRAGRIAELGLKTGDPIHFEPVKPIGLIAPTVPAAPTP